LESYQTALAREPGQVKWRFEYAQLLWQQRQLHEARRELLTVLSQQPDYPGVRESLTYLERQIAEGK
jgi:predicted Zn-dependent protease